MLSGLCSFSVGVFPYVMWCEPAADHPLSSNIVRSSAPNGLALIRPGNGFRRPCHTVSYIEEIVSMHEFDASKRSIQHSSSEGVEQR